MPAHRSRFAASIAAHARQHLYVAPIHVTMCDKLMNQS
jgi:hypothetical protein